MFQHLLVIALLVHSSATFKQISRGDCLSFPTEHMRKRYEVTQYFLTRFVATEMSEETFEDFPLATINAVWGGPTDLQWKNASRFSTCRTIVHQLYEVSKFPLSTKLIGHVCRIHVDKRTQEYVQELTVCTENANFIFTHVCYFCSSRTYVHVKLFATNRFLPDYNYVVVGPIAHYSFYGTHHATHSRTLVAFVIPDNVYFYANARLIFYGHSGHIYKLDLSKNDLYNKGPNRGFFEPNQPPGFENVTPYFPLRV